MPTTLAEAITAIFGVFTQVTGKFSSGVLLFIPAMFVANWGWNKVIRALKRR